MYAAILVKNITGCETVFSHLCTVGHESLYFFDFLEMNLNQSNL